MENDDGSKVGYRTPSRAHQFKKDVCPNPLGRGAKNATGAGDVKWISGRMP